MSWSDPTVWLMVAALVWTIVFSLYRVRRIDDNQTGDILADHATRLGRVETKLDGLPQRVVSHEDAQLLHSRIGAVKDSVAKVGEDVGKIKGVVDGIRETVTQLTSIQMGAGK